MEKGLRRGQPDLNVNRRSDGHRLARVPLLAASLLLSGSLTIPLLSSAAPFSWTEASDTVLVDQQGENSNNERQDAGRQHDGPGSVRQRGREAPINLRQITAEETGESTAVGASPDPGDGPPPSRQDQKADRGAQDAETGREQNIRMWPMPAESYTFTQAFGCVPQIAHFYQPGAGCPVDRPVVHTGLDMAAPEGTPFYAAASGWVTEAGYDREVGVANTRIIIQHEGRNDGYATEYLHWIASFVDVGDHVEAGQLIGEVGSVGYSTGPHLHFSLIDLDTGEHVDPTRWLPQEPGTEGYRGITPRRAAMRLPAGTTAGVPEHTDPNPPDLPTREDVPDSAQARDGRKDKGKRKKSGHGEERRNGDNSGKNRNKDKRSVSGKDGSTSEANSANADEKQADRERERTRKRERNRDGSAKSHDASGENGSGDSRQDGKKKNSSNDSPSSKKDNRESRKDENRVEQADTKTKNNNGNGNGNNSNDGNKKNRNKDSTQQVAEEPPVPVEETPPADKNPPEETDARDSQNAANGDGSSETEGQSDQSDGNGKRDRGERNNDDGTTETAS